MFEIKFQRTGTARFITTEAKTGAPQLKTCIRAAMRLALVKYATGQLPGASLRGRMMPGAFARYGFTRRSDKYEKAQRKALGDAIPYVSPRRLNFAQLAVALTKGSAMDIARQVYRLTDKNRPHMRDLVTVPGTGFSVRESGAHARRVTTVLALPGAAVLNRSGDRSAIYRRELLDLHLGGGRDEHAIWDAFWTEFDRLLNLTTAKAA